MKIRLHIHTKKTAGDWLANNKNIKTEYELAMDWLKMAGGIIVTWRNFFSPSYVEFSI